MRKVFLPCITCVILFCACPENQNLKDFDKIEYNAFTRGRSETITLENGLLKHSENQNTIEKKLKNKDYKKLYKLLKELNLASLDKLTPPTTRHRFDGAMGATLSISKKGNTNTTPTFDDDNPPVEIKKLISYLQSLTK